MCLLWILENTKVFLTAFITDLTAVCKYMIQTLTLSNTLVQLGANRVAPNYFEKHSCV